MSKFYTKLFNVGRTDLIDEWLNSFEDKDIELISQHISKVYFTPCGSSNVLVTVVFYKNEKKL